MMNYFSNRKKWMAYLILLTFVFTCIVPTNLAGGNSAWAATETGYRETPLDRPNDKVTAGEEAITFQVFDYTEYINLKNDYTSETDYRPFAKYFNFRGYPSGSQTGITPGEDGNYDDDGFTVNHATVKRTLVGGYPVLDFTRNAKGETKPAPSDLSSTADLSLAYLFRSGDHAVKAYTANNTLLQYNDGTGYYTYNSRDNAVDFDTDQKNFLVRSYTERSKVTTTYNNGTENYYDFLPFTYWDGETTKQNSEKNNLTYNYDTNGNYWFGMTMEAEFMQPENGLVNGEHMKFEFSGDDDVWVFIDDVLVLDLGGTHGVVNGSIDFATGKVLQYLNWQGTNSTDEAKNTGSDTSFPTTLRDCFDKAQTEAKKTDPNAVIEPVGGWDETGMIFADNSKHTIKFFYMERASSCANCMINFNLQVSETTKTVEKVWNDDKNRDGIRPGEVQVQLFADNVATTSSAITLNEANNWTYTWTELDKYDDYGKEIKYTVKEWKQGSDTALEPGEKFNTEYTVAYETDTEGKDIITNTYEPETIFVEGTKHWEHGDNPEANWPDKITVNLYSDENGDFAWIDSQVVTGSSWTFKFDNLPKYKNQGTEANPDIEEIHYRVFEDEVPFYQPVYDKDSYDITNVYTENATPYVTIGGEKIWQGDEKDLSKRPEKVKVGLFQNNSVDPIATTFTALDWTFYFDEQPRYDDNGKPYVYTVKELDVPEGYISMTEEDRNDITYDFAFDITNILHTGEVGKVKVKKVVSGDGAPESFDFVLSVKAQKYNLSDEVTTERKKLEKAYQDAVTAESEAQKDWNDAVDAFKRNAGAYSTSSAYQFVLVRQTSPSAYQFTMLDKNNRMEVTTSSAMTLFDATDKLSDSDSILKTVANAIGSLADDFKDVTRKASLFLKSLKEALGDTIDAAIEFQTDDVNALLTAQSQLFDAKVRVDATSSAVYEFVQSNTTPSAVTIITKDGSGSEKTHEMKLGDLSDAETYRLEFSLKNNQEYSATILAAEGVELDYTVWEDLSKTDKANYEKTIVELNGNKVGEFTTGNPSYTEDLTDAEVADLVFTNYYDKDDPWTPLTPDPEDPPEKKEQTPDPETTIPDENVPTGSVEPGEPLDEFDEPEIPLGDAPATGDNTNAVPFMALLFVAMAGLVITRRTFN